MSIEANLFARKVARQAYELLEAEAATCIEGSENRFWDVVLAKILEHQPPPPERADVPMTDKESKAFDSYVMPFGEHRGKAMREVPMGYLIWLAALDDVRAKVQRYLRSSRIANEIDQMNTED
jgi:uncharacterized protein (DUF3820 family)